MLSLLTFVIGFFIFFGEGQFYKKKLVDIYLYIDFIIFKQNFRILKLEGCGKKKLL